MWLLCGTVNHGIVNLVYRGVGILAVVERFTQKCKVNRRVIRCGVCSRPQKSLLLTEKLHFNVINFGKAIEKRHIVVL